MLILAILLNLNEKYLSNSTNILLSINILSLEFCTLKIIWQNVVRINWILYIGKNT